MNIIDKFENEVSKSEDGTYLLKLYVAGITPKSIKAVNNLKKTLAEYKSKYQLEIIDIYQNPIIAKNGQIIAAPTLIKELPPPVRRFIGDMSDESKLIIGLELKSQ